MILDAFFINDIIRETYKCVIPKIPTSSVAAFLKDKKGNLELKTVRNERNVNSPISVADHRKVFSAGATGDSGTPLSANIVVSEPDSGAKEKRHVIVAIFSNGGGIYTEKGTIPIKECRDYGTKVSKHMVSWIKKLGSIDIQSGLMFTILVRTINYLYFSLLVCLNSGT